MTETTTPAQKFVDFLKENIRFIKSRIEYRTKEPFTPELFDYVVKDDTLWLTFKDKDVIQELTLPVPFKTQGGNIIIRKGHVERACGSWMFGEKEISYWELVSCLLTKQMDQFIQTGSKRIFLERLLRSFIYGSSAIVFRNFQKIFDEFVNKLPLVGTDLQAWAMCNRIQIMDPKWDALTPAEALSYQKDVNIKLFPWTSLGQSDSGMCNNTILKVDVRKTVPFGLSHHNPKRNLYQTLGMVGDEIPLIMSQSEKELSDKGIVRTGWNLMTAFIDMPLNFEDQIIVNERLKDKFVTETKAFVCYGTVLAEEGDSLHFLYPLSIEPDGSINRFDIEADSARVLSVINEQINFNGSKTNVKVINVEYKRTFKDGLKLTNRHGNKGIIFMSETGVVHDPVRGDIPIDVIVSAQSVMKRKNFGQLFEALSSLLNGPYKKIVVKDNFIAHIDKVKKALASSGYREDGTLDTTTKWGKFLGVCGWVHWGCIKTPEDQVWTKHDTNSTNSMEIRTAGNKISHIELHSLMTIFGKNNPIVNEIMQYKQGTNLVDEGLTILETLRGNNVEVPTISWDNIVYIDQGVSFFHHMHELSGSLCDTTTHTGRFYIQLPNNFKYIVKKDEKGKYKEEFIDTTEDEVPSSAAVILDKILMPSIEMRRPWQHQSGLWGLTDTAALANSILGSIHKYNNGTGKKEQIGRTIYLYLHGINKTLATKTGYISNYCMSIRYPFTVKGTAAVGEGLEENEIEIHENRAKDLRVKTGDLVLVERFPCLGFMSLRVQKIKVTRDPNARYVIRVSGSSLASQALDFDGDVIYLMSFFNPHSVEALKKEFNSPHILRKNAFQEASNKKIPEFREIPLDDYGIEIFPSITREQNADIVENLTGVKRSTGTVIALCYNIMRIMEKEIGYSDENSSIAIECLLDKVANSVFSVKHAGRSLEAECREAISIADSNMMIELGLNPEASVLLSNIIKKLARKVGINPNSLKTYYDKGKRPTVINRIIQRYHKTWLSSRSELHPIELLESLDTSPSDLPSWMYLHSKTKETPDEKRAKQFFNDSVEG